MVAAPPLPLHVLPHVEQNETDARQSPAAGDRLPMAGRVSKVSAVPQREGARGGVA
eukprot:CAMPEP_0181228876 /NCGR_PEP_ID=MMETSP1096-20121128/33586_1 /TAXON_ID=156174 ORGANISM="Chrysochromulina ericina, Strain CCMP281" /NCGR_SAMPLE_ID=MMETSP1096 /ASSEMBLY_ACC=CAM_ASM_000453 /LENGTH=55 /DNA_ID=CAMNT_0023322439 /DNA_START=264 /DNA_END=431 /DNA_ORIENTATION=-